MSENVTETTMIPHKSKPGRKYTNLDEIKTVKVYTSVAERRFSQFVSDWIVKINKAFVQKNLILKKRCDKLDGIKTHFTNMYTTHKKGDYLTIAVMAEHHSNLIIAMERIRSNTKKKDGVLDVLAPS
jgi:hypothetical protein